MLKIVADDKIPFLKGVLEPYAEMVYLPGSSISRADLLDADALIVRTRTRCNRDLLEGTKVKCIATATIGFDHIDAGYCVSANIRWTSAPGCNAASVQQYVASALSILSHRMHTGLRNMTLGIIGVGNVGKTIQVLGNALGMKVLLNDPPRERAEGRDSFVSLDTLLAESDVICLHVPLNREGMDKTLHMADESFFNMMKKTAWFLNASRGEAMDTSALKKALFAGRIAGAVIDVWEDEPHIDLDLLQLAAIATPHIAGYSTDGKANGTAMSVNSISRFFGLGLDHWYPSSLLAPQEPFLRLHHTGEDLVKEAFLATYDVMQDDRNLRQSPGTFEQQRGNYPLRREYKAYTVAGPADDPVIKTLQQLGFGIKPSL